MQSVHRELSESGWRRHFLRRRSVATHLRRMRRSPNAKNVTTKILSVRYAIICAKEYPPIAPNAVTALSIQPTEECDDGNTITETCLYGQNGCTVCNAECQWEAGATEICGDMIISHEEDCEDGNITLKYVTLITKVALSVLTYVKQGRHCPKLRRWHPARYRRSL